SCTCLQLILPIGTTRKQFQLHGTSSHVF
ncbi:hypothetical protein GCK32_022375, partial [Trichostrongylus colubriformis]